MKRPRRTIVRHVHLVIALVMLAASAIESRATELLMFETAGCPWCAAWTRDVGPGYAKSKEGRRAPLRRLDVADATRAGVALGGPVTVSPTFVLIDNGREVSRITGYPGAAFFWGMLDTLFAKLDKGARAAPAGRDSGPVDLS